MKLAGNNIGEFFFLGALVVKKIDVIEYIDIFAITPQKDLKFIQFRNMDFSASKRKDTDVDFSVLFFEKFFYYAVDFFESGAKCFLGGKIGFGKIFTLG